MLSSPLTRLYLNNRLIKECRSVSYEIERSHNRIYGIDSNFPQELAPEKTMVTGNLTLYNIQGDDGVQGYNLVPYINEILYQPYFTIRVEDRKNGKNLFYCPQAVVTREATSVQVKQYVITTVSFEGIVPYMQGDLQR